MKTTMINNAHFEGKLYDHKLEYKTTGPNSKNPGTKYIAGEISVATDPECKNICKVYYTYVTPTTKNGSPNATYNVLADIIDAKAHTQMNCAIDESDVSYVRVDASISLNEWYDKESNLVSTMRAEGGFVHFINKNEITDAKRNQIKADMLITSFKRIEENSDKNIPEHGEVRGAIFNFRKEVLPVTFKIYSEQGMVFFEDYDVSATNPMFTQIFGIEESTTVTTEKVEETAFGEDVVETSVRNRKEFVIVSAKNPYEWDTEETLTAVELKELMAQRELKLAELKARREEYDKAKNGAATADTVSIGGFNF